MSCANGILEGEKQPSPGVHAFQAGAASTQAALGGAKAATEESDLYGCEASASCVHATLCALVVTQAVKHSAWAAYAAVLQDPETEAFFRARLPAAGGGDGDGDGGGDSGGGGGGPPSKKRKTTESDPAESVPDVAAVCEHCGGVIPNVTIRVACLDGTTLNLTVPERSHVTDVKCMLGKVTAACFHPHGFI